MAVAVPRVTVPSSRVTVLLASAVPPIVGLVLLEEADIDVREGASGAVVSTVSAIDLDAAETLPAVSVALAVSVWTAWLKVEPGV